MEKEYHESIKKIRRYSYLLFSIVPLIFLDIGIFNRSYKLESVQRELLTIGMRTELSDLLDSWNETCRDFTMEKMVRVNYNQKQSSPAPHETLCIALFDNIVTLKEELEKRPITYTVRSSEFKSVPYLNIQVRNLYFPIMLKLAFSILVLVMFWEVKVFKRLYDLADHQSEKIQFINQFEFDIKLPHFYFLSKRVLRYYLYFAIFVFAFLMIKECFNYFATTSVSDQFLFTIRIVGVVNAALFIGLLIFSRQLLRELKSLEFAKIVFDEK